MCGRLVMISERFSPERIGETLLAFDRSSLGCGKTQAEAAGSARDLVKGFLRPNAVKPEDAVVQLMDARGTLLELQVRINESRKQQFLLDQATCFTTICDDGHNDDDDDNDDYEGDE